MKTTELKKGDKILLYMSVDLNDPSRTLLTHSPLTAIKLHTENPQSFDTCIYWRRFDKNAAEGRLFSWDENGDYNYVGGIYDFEMLAVWRDNQWIPIELTDEQKNFRSVIQTESPYVNRDNSPCVIL